jgi:hypothetical protein
VITAGDVLVLAMSLTFVGPSSRRDSVRHAPARDQRLIGLLLRIWRAELFPLLARASCP